MTDSSPQPNVSEADALVGLLTRQRDLYGSLSGLSGRQESLIAEGKTEELLTVLSERQSLVDELTGINREIAPLRGKLTELSEQADDDVRTTLRTLVDDVQNMLQTIIEQDEKDKQSLEASKSKVGQQLKQTTAAPRALNAYKSAPGAAPQPGRQLPNTSRFTDKRG